MAIGRRLGADVNFFLAGVNQAYGKGVGDEIRPYPCRKRLWFILVIMPKQLLTAAVYRTFSRAKKALSLTKEKGVVTLISPNFTNGWIERMARFMRNDLQEASIKLYPVIGKAIRIFDKLGIQPHLMSGSGPAVFAVTDSEKKARNIANRARRAIRFCKTVLICRTY